VFDSFSRLLSMPKRGICVTSTRSAHLRLIKTAV